MTEDQYKEFLEIKDQLGDCPSSVEDVNLALASYVSKKITEFTDLTLTLSNLSLYRMQQRATLTADWISLITSCDLEQQANVIKFFDQLLAELKSPTPLGTRLLAHLDTESELKN